MACIIDLLNSSGFDSGGTWTYKSAIALNGVIVDGSSVNLVQDDPVGIDDSPELEFNASHNGNSYLFEYVIPPSGGCPEVIGDFTINVIEGPCDIADGSIDICEGNSTWINLIDIIDITNCNGAPTINSWTLISGPNGSYLDLPNAQVRGTGANGGTTIVVQAEILGTSGGCVECGNTYANATINFQPKPYAGNGGTVDICI